MTDLRPSQPSGIFGLIFFGIAWMALCFFAVFQIHGWSAAYQRNLALIQSGKVPRQSIYVVSMDPPPNGKHDWTIGLGSSVRAAATHYESTSDPAGLYVGAPLEAYLINQKLFVPRFYGNYQEGELVFSLAGLLPLVIGASVVLWRNLTALKKSSSIS